MASNTTLERIASLETQILYLKEIIKEDTEKSSRDIEEIKNSLNDLLNLKNKGIGAFWLASTIVGSGVIALLMSVAHWLGIGSK
jgi:hypothetical protein